MFECFGWNEAYSTDKFRFTWNIAHFVNEGKRLDNEGKITEQQFEIITKCWLQDGKKRLPIEKIVEELEILLN